MAFTKKIYKHPQYVAWRKKVYERDGFTCRLCGKDNVYIEAHHIMPKSKFPLKIFEVGNGITLCAKGRGSCHKRVTGQELRWATLFRKILRENIWDSKKITELIAKMDIKGKPIEIKANSTKKKKIRLIKRVKPIRR